MAVQRLYDVAGEATTSAGEFLNVVRRLHTQANFDATQMRLMGYTKLEGGIGEAFPPLEKISKKTEEVRGKIYEARPRLESLAGQAADTAVVKAGLSEVSAFFAAAAGVSDDALQPFAEVKQIAQRIFKGDPGIAKLWADDVDDAIAKAGRMRSHAEIVVDALAREVDDIENFLKERARALS